MKVLLDTCVLAELRNPKGHPAVKEAIDQLPDDALYLSVLTLGEITKGIAGLPASKKKRDLESWLDGLEQNFADRILPVDRDTAVHWGQLTARAAKQGITIPPSDGLIAATALRYNLRVMTRNTRDFATSGAPIQDPWPAKP